MITSGRSARLSTRWCQPDLARTVRRRRDEEAEIDAGLPRWCTVFSARYVELLGRADTSQWELGPYANEALLAVKHRALLTGNPPAVAHARMVRLGLAELFAKDTGGFGCEREDRVELFALTRERAGNWPAERTVAVGDTPLDVSSAHAGGCRCIGVTTGHYNETQLREADAVISNLSELQRVLSTLE